MIESVCPNCSHTFHYYPSSPKRYCSRQCQSAAARTTTECPGCGKSFWYHRSWPRKYCSLACSSRANVSRQTGRPTGTRYTATCEVCGAAFSTVPSQPGRFCSRACFGQWLSENWRGEAHPKFGKPSPRPHQRVPKTCPVCSTEFLVKRSHLARRRFCSKACQGAAQVEAWAGENNPGWTGGYEPYYGPSWRPAMRAVRARDKVCQRCGKTPKELRRELDVHHLVPFKTFGLARHIEANVLSNLVALCNVCHLNEEWATNRRAHESA